MRQRTLLIALAAIAIFAAAGIAIALQPDEAASQRQQQGFTVSFAAAESALGENRENQLRDWALLNGDTLHLLIPRDDVNESFRATLATKDGPVVADALQQTMIVTVREVTANGCGD